MKNVWCCSEYLNVEDNLIQYNILYVCCNNNYWKMFGQNLKIYLLIYTNFQTMMSIGLFFCCKTMFTLMNAWMKWNIIREDFYSHLKMKDITNAD